LGYESHLFQLMQESMGNSQDYIEEGMDAVDETSGWNMDMERRRKRIEKFLGTDVQLEHGGIRDWQANDYRQAYSYTGGSLRNLESRDQRRAFHDSSALRKEAYQLAAEGKHEEADAKIAQATALENEFGINEENGFALGEKFAPKKIPNELMSPAMQIHGGNLRDALELRDPESETSQRFMDSLTSGPLAAVDAGERNAGRALATAERTAARGTRDAAMSAGGARSFGTEQATMARSAERFAATRASVATEAGAARAQIHGEAAKFYESFSRAWSIDATAAARDGVNNLSFIRDSFREMQISLTAITAQLAGVGAQTQASLSQQAMQSGTAYRIQQDQIEAEKDSQTMGIITAVVGIALGAVTGGLGAWAVGGSVLAGAAAGAAGGATSLTRAATPQH
jgi:hypothetical protein